MSQKVRDTEKYCINKQFCVCVCIWLSEGPFSPAILSGDCIPVGWVVDEADVNSN